MLLVSASKTISRISDRKPCKMASINDAWGMSIRFAINCMVAM
jgi:hypothetical protein